VKIVPLLNFRGFFTFNFFKITQIELQFKESGFQRIVFIDNPLVMSENMVLLKEKDSWRLESIFKLECVFLPLEMMSYFKF